MLTPAALGKDPPGKKIDDQGVGKRPPGSGRLKTIMMVQPIRFARDEVRRMSRDIIGTILMDHRLRAEVGVRVRNPSPLSTDTAFVAIKNKCFKVQIYSLHHYLRAP